MVSYCDFVKRPRASSAALGHPSRGTLREMFGAVLLLTLLSARLSLACCSLPLLSLTTFPSSLFPAESFRGGRGGGRGGLGARGTPRGAFAAGTNGSPRPAATTTSAAAANPTASSTPNAWGKEKDAAPAAAAAEEKTVPKATEDTTSSGLGDSPPEAPKETTTKPAAPADPTPVNGSTTYAQKGKAPVRGTIPQGTKMSWAQIARCVRSSIACSPWALDFSLRTCTRARANTAADAGYISCPL